MSQQGERRRVLKLVVASPGDVKTERDLLDNVVVADLNRVITPSLGFHIELLRWETDAYPGFHLKGPQGLIDEVLKIDQCDIMVGIFWKRFGTPTKQAGSGTEHELRSAYTAWKASGGRRPHIMMYFKEQPYAPKSPQETEQWTKVLAFKEEFEDQFEENGLFWNFEDERDFERLTRNHLTRYLVRNAGQLGGSSYRIIKSADDLHAANGRIVNQAREILYATGSRSRDAKYLEAIEQRLREVPQLIHYRVLFGPPHHQLFKDHLLELLQIRSPSDRSQGFKTIHLGLYAGDLNQFETFILGNEQEALVLLPSFSGVGEYNSAVIFTDVDEVAELKGFVKQLYQASDRVETPMQIKGLQAIKAGARQAAGNGSLDT